MKKLLYLKDYELKQYIEKIFMGYRETVSDAKKNKDWSSADLIRNELAKIGVKIKDTREGSCWEKE